MPEVSQTNWNQFISAFPDAHLLQTGEWGQLKSAFGWEAIRLINSNGDGGMQVLFRRLPLGRSFAYIPKGPIGGSFAELWPEVDQICRRINAIFLKLEMDAWEGAEGENSSLRISDFQAPVIPGFRMSNHFIQPPRTILVRLDGAEEDILARMKQKTRYNIRLAQKKGVSVRHWDDLGAFYEMMLVTGERDGFGVHGLEYFRQAYELFHPARMAQLLVAEYEGQPLAALMVFARGRRSWYIYGASTDEERNRMPTYLLQWEAMRWARTQGATEYDLWGVPDEEEASLEALFTERHDGLWGVYRFKRGFGGELRRSVQAVDRVYNPVLYKIYEWRMAGRHEA